MYTVTRWKIKELIPGQIVLNGELSSLRAACVGVEKI